MHLATERGLLLRLDKEWSGAALCYKDDNVSDMKSVIYQLDRLIFVITFVNGGIHDDLAGWC